MRAALGIAVALAALLAAGCGESGSGTAGQEQHIQDHEKRLAALEESNRALQSQVQKLEWQYAAAGTKAEAPVRAPQMTKEDVARAVREVFAEQAAAMEARQAEGRQRQRVEAAERLARLQEQQINALAQALALTDEQKLQVKALSDEMRRTARDAVAVMRQQGNFDPGNVQQIAADVRAKAEEGMRKILSDEQFQKYRQLPEEARALGVQMLDAMRQPARPGRVWGGAVPD